MDKRILILFLASLVSTAFGQGFTFRNPDWVASLSKRPAAGGGGAPAVEASTFVVRTNYNGFLTNTITTTGANRLILIQIQFGDNDAADIGAGPQSLTIDGGSTLTNNVNWNTNDGGNFMSIQQFYVLAPSSGAHTIVYGAATTFGLFFMGSIAITNAHQTSPFGTVAKNKGNSTAPSVTVSSAASVELVIGACATDSQNSLTVNGGTLIIGINNINNDVDFGVARYAGSASVSAAWTQTSGPWVAAGVSIKAP